MKPALLVVACVLATRLAHAQDATASAPPSTVAPPARGIPLELALEAAKLAVDACKSQDQKVAVSVLDSAGEVRLVLAADGAA